MPTFKDVDFRNNMQKVYVTDEQKEKILEKLNRDVEVGEFKLEYDPFDLFLKDMKKVKIGSELNN